MMRALLLSLCLVGTLSLSAQVGYYGVEKTTPLRWSLGLKLGTSAVRGDVTPDISNSYQVGLSLQKQVSRVIDFRLQLHNGKSQGLDTEVSTGIKYNKALNGTPDRSEFLVAYDTLNPAVYHNYSMEYFDASIQLKVNLNRLFSPSGNDTWDLYVFGGLGTMLYASWINALDENNQIYDYANIEVTGSDAIRAALIDMRDDTYETYIDQDVINKTGIGDYAIISTFMVGTGFRIKLSDHWAVGLEGRYTYTRDDLLDGQEWKNDNTLPETLALSETLDAHLSGSLVLAYFFGGEE